MISCEIKKKDIVALHYAEGWLSSGFGGSFLAGWNGAGFAGKRGVFKLILALKVKHSLDTRGLKKGFDLKTLSFFS